MLNEASLNTITLVLALGTQQHVTFVYTDRDGVVSFRTVRVLAIEKATKQYGPIVRCFDLNRKAPRSFRLANIDLAEIPGLH